MAKTNTRKTNTEKKNPGRPSVRRSNNPESVPSYKRGGKITESTGTGPRSPKTK